MADAVRTNIGPDTVLNDTLYSFFLSTIVSSIKYLFFSPFLIYFSNKLQNIFCPTQVLNRIPIELSPIVWCVDCEANNTILLFTRHQYNLKSPYISGVFLWVCTPLLGRCSGKFVHPYKSWGVIGCIGGVMQNFPFIVRRF